MKKLKSILLGKVRLPIVFLGVIFLSMALVLAVSRQTQEVRQRAAVSQKDFTQYVNLNQSKQIFMRYPLGRIGLWSRSEGEIADSVTRNIRLYPLVDQLTGKDNADWRSTIVAHPAETAITYGSGTPAKGSTVALTVTPNVAVYRYHFTNVSSFGAVGITLGGTAEIHGGLTWSSTLTAVDNQTIQATLVSGSKTTYYYIKLNIPGTGSGSGGQGYMQFGPGTPDVTVAVALSQTSMSQAQQYFTNEFSDFNFASASQRLKDAWDAKLGKIDVQSADQLTKQQLYTGLYTVYANIVNATDGSPYASYATAYGSPLLTIGSSIGWAYIGGGYFRAAYDQGRSIYYLLTLIDPQVMTDLLHTYQAQYDRDKVLLGNWDPYSPTAWTDQQWGFWGGMFTRAQLMGVTGVDYVKAKNAIADTFGNPNNIMSKSGYLAKGYIPADSGVSNYMSRALDWATDIDGLTKLASILGDNATYSKFSSYSRAYVNNWDSANSVFRAKNSNGSWAPLGNGGFFEGTAQTYGFDEPQDVLGLADLYGDANMTAKISTMLISFATDYGFNDYVPQYSYMPIYSNSPSTAQNIVRTKIIPQFNSLNMWEDSGGGDMYYTHNAGELVMAVLGLYPYQAPGAQWTINSPAVTTAVIHGIKDITIQANNNAPGNIYISSIQANGQTFPSHLISGKTLIAGNTTITLTMVSNPARIGSMYVTGTDGEVLAAGTDNASYLQFQNDPIVPASRAKIYTTKQPTAVSVNGTPLTSWTYDPTTSSLNIKGIPAGTVLISFGGSVTPP
jgi:putative alpha-1,2-mannosidase